MAIFCFNLGRVFLQLVSFLLKVLKYCHVELQVAFFQSKYALAIELGINGI